jgi:hypothetical protein
MSYTTHIMLIHVEPLGPWPSGKGAKLVVAGDDEVAIDCLSLNFVPTSKFEICGVSVEVV